MRFSVALVVVAVTLLALGGVHAYGEASIVNSVEGLDNYTGAEDTSFQPGEKVNLYVETNGVNHKGLTAVNYYVIVYNDRLEVKDILTKKARFKSHVDDVFVTFEFTVPEGWKEGQYFIKVRAHDVADGEEFRKAYARALDRYNPSYSKAEKILDLKEGIGVGGYGDFTKKETVWTYVLAETLRFSVEGKEPGEPTEPKKKLTRYQVNVSYHTDSQELNKSSFISGKPFTFNFTTGEGVHEGLVALDYFFMIINENKEPIYQATSSERFIEYPGSHISHTFTHELSKGNYYLLVKIYDRANPGPLQEFLDTLDEYQESYDSNKIEAYKSLKEGRDVNDGPYETLGLLKPKSEDHLVYFNKIPFKVVPELAKEEKEKLTRPVIRYTALKPSSFTVNKSEPFSVEVKFDNVGKEGTVDVILNIRGEQKGYRFRKSVFANPAERNTVTFNITRNLSEGAWKVTLENSTLSEVVLVQKPEKVRELKKKEEEREKALTPTEVEKPKTPLAIIGVLIAGLLALYFMLKRRYRGEVPQEFVLPIKITLAIQVVLIILYLVYLFR